MVAVTALARRLERIEETATRTLELVTPKPAPEPYVQDRARRVGDLLPVGVGIALRLLMKPVPAPYWKAGVDRAWIACACRRGHLIPTGKFHECSCGRCFVFTGRSVHVIPLDS